MFCERKFYRLQGILCEGRKIKMIPHIVRKKNKIYFIFLFFSIEFVFDVFRTPNQNKVFYNGMT